MKLLWVLTLILNLTGPRPESFSLVSYFRDSILELEKTGAELHHQGTVIKVTTRNMWISENEENNLWVVDVQGTPKEVYVIDSPERKEISHYERVHHDAVTHQEPVYEERRYWVVNFPTAYGTMTSETFYSYADALSAVGTRDGIFASPDEGLTERYIASYKTIVDREAYDETVKVIDQYAREEIGHWETKIMGEIGHWEQGNAELAGIGEGHYISKMIRSGAEQ